MLRGRVIHAAVACDAFVRKRGLQIAIESHAASRNHAYVIAPSTPVAQELILLGGGHSHVAVLKAFAMRPAPGARVTLVARDVWTPYSGMLPGYVAGHYSFEEAHIDLRRLCRWTGARFIRGTSSGLDLKDKRLLFSDHPPITFDLLSINIGSTPRATGVPGVAKYALPIKPIDRFLQEWERILHRVEQGTADGVRIAVVGGGAGGVELMLTCRYRIAQLMRQKGISDPRVSFHLVTGSESLLPSHNRRTQGKFERIVAERWIQVYPGHRVIEVARDKLICEGARTVPFDILFWVTNASAPAWLRESGLQVDSEGFVEVNDTLQSCSHPFVFAAGDIASMRNYSRPKSGVFAVRQGMPLARNLRAALCGELLRPFRPQRQFLSIIGTGEKYAVATRGWWAIEGGWVWKVKDWIDRRWMRKYQEPPARAMADGGEVAGDKQPAVVMRCGGCGAKVGSTVLARVLNRLPASSAQGVTLGLDSRDDAAAISVPPGKVAVQSVDFFRSFIDDPYLFAKIATNHSLNDIYAKGAMPHSALAIVTVPWGTESKVEEDLWQVLSGATEVLSANAAALIGGHSAEGAELGFGLSVTGFADPDRLLRKSSVCAGDALILTKSLGTGTLSAAEMRGRAKGEWIEAAIDSMLLSGKDAVACLLRHHANACTDVTGFGLIGHLVEMLKGTELGAKILLDALPCLPGVEQTFAQDIVSSLHPANLRARHLIANVSEVSEHPRYPLLFDPQTAGGFLASVPASDADACVTELKKLGYPAATIVGQVTAATGEAAPITIRAASGHKA